MCPVNVLPEYQAVWEKKWSKRKCFNKQASYAHVVCLFSESDNDTESPSSQDKTMNKQGEAAGGWQTVGNMWVLYERRASFTLT